MATVNDIGVPGQPLSTPPLTAWQAAVRDALNANSDADTWKSWTPTIAGGTVSAVDAKYRRTPGGLLIFSMQATVATVTGNWSFTLPVNAVIRTVGAAGLYPAGGLWPGTWNVAANSALCNVYAHNVVGAYIKIVALSATIPAAWAAGDMIFVAGQYRVAPLP